MGVAGAQGPGVLQAIVYNRGSLKLLDQRELPVVTRYIDIPDSTAGWQAIKEMVVRGAPAIAIAAALSLAAEVSNLKILPESQEDALAFLKDRLEFLVSSRPTAVNLHDAKEKLYRLASQAAAQSSEVKDTIMAYVEAAEAMLAADIEANKAIGKYGAHYILDNQDKEKKLSVLTHCNTGSLATAGYGTALGVIRALHAVGKLDTAYCTETRPYNQGSRLTAFELVHDKIPSVLIADSAAAALQQSGRVDAVVVGADRIAANGDTANKIGTYSLALSAFAHKIPFYVAAPLTSIDTEIISGQDIVIEERSPSELTHTHGDHGSQVAASGISVWNPAFDVTAAEYITAIITDKGVITKESGSSKFDIPSFINEIERKAIKENDEIKDCPKINEVGFYHLTEGTLASYIKALPEIAERLGEPANEWKIEEVGDGNLNYVYIVTGPKGSFVLKQAIPYVRCVGESWPMTIERAFFEASALKVHGSYCPEHVPEVYYFDVKMASIVMQYLEPPHIILRKGLISGVQYPSLAEHVSDYLANTLFSTSLLAHTTEEHKPSVKIFLGNFEMCRLTEQVIFTEPYMIASNNRWTSPQLDEDVKILREDDEIKVEIAGLKAKFCERSQALIHGDLHTGSIMVTSTSTKVIDPEFAFYGPMGFDIGAFLGNLFLAFYAQDGHASNNDDRKDYKIWILKTVAETWTLFTKKFILLWDNSFKMPGDAYPKEVYNSSNVRKLSQLKYLNDLFEDALGYAAAKMIRRIVGIAHVEDFESIKDTNIRANCERRALHFAKSLLKRRYKIGTIEEVINMAVSFESEKRSK